MPASLPREAQRVSAWLCRIYLHFCIDPIRCPLLETQVIQRIWIGPLSRTRINLTSKKAGVDLISDVLPFGRLWYGEPNASDFVIKEITAPHTDGVKGGCSPQNNRGNLRRY